MSMRGYILQLACGGNYLFDVYNIIMIMSEAEKNKASTTLISFISALHEMLCDAI